MLANEPSVRVPQQRFQIQKFSQYSLPTHFDVIRRMKGIGGLYIHYCYRLGYLPRYYQKSTSVHYLLRDDLLKLNRISDEMRFLARNDIRTDSHLSDYKVTIQKQMEPLIDKRNHLYREVRRKGVEPEIISEKKEQIARINLELKTHRDEMRMRDSIAKRSGVLQDK